MIVYFIRFITALGLVFCVSIANAEEDNCNQHVAVNRNLFSNELKVNQQVIRQLESSFFGFNVEWMAFQWSFWDKALKKVNSEVADYLRFFPGAIYRYPGGSISNTMDWRDTIGALARRPQKQFVTYTKPFKAEFGLDEYLSFVKDVNGKSWYVVNLYGDEVGEKPILQLQEQAASLANYVTSQSNTNNSIYRWELGNELERAEYLWLPDKIAMHSSKVAQSIKQIAPTAQFVSFLQEYNALEKKGVKAPEFNKYMGLAMQPITSEFAMHLYYDGKPGGQPIPAKLKSICSAVKNASVSGKSPPVWITEHARVPPNAWVDPNWKKSWKKTADLEAAIGVSDLMIALTMMPEVKGAFIHSLHGTDGPWPLFHRVNNKPFAPSVVFWALKMLRSSMLDTVISNQMASVNNSGYDGGYDVRATVMTNGNRDAYSIWVINRSDKDTQVAVEFPALKNISTKATHTTLSNQSITANNYTNTQTVTPQTNTLKMRFDAAGKTSITLLSHSVSTVTFSLSK